MTRRKTNKTKQDEIWRFYRRVDQFFWDQTLCYSATNFRRFEGLQCLHLQDKVVEHPEAEDTTFPRKFANYWAGRKTVAYQKAES
jgi:hypothetical protein